MVAIFTLGCVAIYRKLDRKLLSKPADFVGSTILSFYCVWVLGSFGVLGYEALFRIVPSLFFEVAISK